MSIDLPISKSIANRILMLQAVHGDPLMEVSSDMPDDVLLIHHVLSTLYPVACRLSPVTFQLNNCGTALRFLTAYCASQQGLEVVLDGSERLRERPIAQEVDALRLCGAHIEYRGREGYAPLYIKGTALKAPAKGLRIDNPLSTQMVSALLLIGLPVQTNSRSPYIQMTRHLIASYSSPTSENALLPSTFYLLPVESDWSSASYWYEYIALHGGEMELKGLTKNSLQGDRVVAQLFRPLGVDTLYTDAGVRIARTRKVNPWPYVVNFHHCPDLYPAVKMTCLQLGKPLIALGTSALRYKESDRLAALSTFDFRLSTFDFRLSTFDFRLSTFDFRLSTFDFRLSTFDFPSSIFHIPSSPFSSHHDHRIAMSLLAADLPCDDPACISKSYPHFVEQLNHQSSITNHQSSIINHQYTPITPRRGINDDHLGKKHALHKLIAEAATEYVWLLDDDITPPLTCSEASSQLPNLPKADLYILPLRMQGGDTLLEQLQIAEYAAIQEITMRTAKRGCAVMCSGANMIVRRTRWLESWPDIHPDIPSGDDMFLLESFRRRQLTILAIDRPEFTATVFPLRSWRAFFRQRMRWAGKAPHYTDPYIRRYGAIVLCANLLQLICPPVLLIKFPIEYRLIKKRDPKVSFWIAFILELVYPWYVLLCILGGLLRRNW